MPSTQIKQDALEFVQNALTDNLVLDGSGVFDDKEGEGWVEFVLDVLGHRLVIYVEYELDPAPTFTIINFKTVY